MGQVCDAIREEGIKIGESRGLKIGEAKGIEIGESNGIKKGEENIIVSMLENGYEIEEISKITKKPKEYILKIREEKIYN